MAAFSLDLPISPQVWIMAAFSYILVLEPFMKQNNRQGSSYLFYLVAELRCYPQCYKRAM